MRHKVKVIIISVFVIVSLIVTMTFVFNLHPIVQIFLIISFTMVDLLISAYYLGKAKLTINVNQFRGSGTQKDPIIIEKIESEYPFPMIIGLKKHCIIQNVETSYLEIEKSENILVKDSTFDDLVITDSNHIILSNIKIREYLAIQKTRELSLFSSEVNLLHLKRTNFIKVDNCSIVSLKKTLRNDNLRIT